MTNKQRLGRIRAMIWICIILSFVFEVSYFFFKGKQTESDRIIYVVYGVAAAILYAIELGVKIIINKEKE